MKEHDALLLGGVEQIDLQIEILNEKRRRAEAAEFKHRKAIAALQNRKYAISGLLDEGRDPKDIIHVFGKFHGMAIYYDTLLVIYNDRTSHVLNGSCYGSLVSFRNEHAGGVSPLFHLGSPGSRDLERRAFPHGRTPLDPTPDLWGVAIRWLVRIRLCSICRQVIVWSNDEARTLAKFPKEAGRGQIPFEEIKGMEAVSFGDHITYGIHECCKPNSDSMKQRRKAYSKGALERREGLIIEMLAKCWPSFAIHSAAPDKERIVRKWAIRNPGRVSTPAARAFFQIHFGIKNIESALTKTNRKTHEHNPKQKA